jgi:DNA-binding response OmpR family regulator
VVGDDEDMREYLGSFLEELYQVFYASNGQEALSVLEQHSVDLIVSDIGMPIMDGFALLRCLRVERENFSPFLFLTAHIEKAEVMQALLLGVDAYITKPFESDELLARINGLLINNRRRKEAYLQTAQTHPESNQDPLVEGNASYRSKWLKELEGIANEEIGNPNIRIPDLAFKMAVSERTFRNRIKEYSGFSPHEYMMEVRMTKALHLLAKGTYLTVAEVANAVGLEYSSYFTKNFKERYGKAPSEYL